MPLPLTCNEHPHDIHVILSTRPSYLMIPSPLQAEVKVETFGPQRQLGLHFCRKGGQTTAVGLVLKHCKWHMVLGKMGPVQWVNLLLCGSLTFTSRSKTGTFRAQKQAFIQKTKKIGKPYMCWWWGLGRTTLLEVTLVLKHCKWHMVLAQMHPAQWVNLHNI